MPQVLETPAITNETYAHMTLSREYPVARFHKQSSGFWRSILAMFTKQTPEHTTEYAILLERQEGALEHIRRRDFSLYERGSVSLIGNIHASSQRVVR